jgi:predicted lysophospholipase L1 biosynthesis ABC-type transport system permease subunit
MLTSIRNRRRDLAVLSALGADRRWITRVVHWQATTVVVLATAIGVPLGLVAGRFVFTLFADSIGTRNDASMPWSVLAAVTTGVVVLANITAALPGRQARRLTPARVLHSE